MRRSLRQLLLIGRMTALEGLQQPICLLLTLTCVLATILQPFLQLHSFGEEGRMARDGGLAFMLVFGLFVAGFTSGSTLAEELRSGTAATTLAKPVGRLTFIIGKWLGVVVGLAVFCTISTCATLLAERTAEHTIETAHFAGSIIDRFAGLGTIAAIVIALALGALLNFRRSTRFSLATTLTLLAGLPLVILLCGLIDRTGSLLPAYSLQVNLRLLPAAALIFMLLILYAAVATALSTRLPTAVTLLLCALLLFIGFLSDSWLGQSTSVIGRLAYSLIPDVQHFWLADAIARQGRIPLRYLAHAAVYTLSMSSLVLGIGYAAFRTRDVG